MSEGPIDLPTGEPAINLDDFVDHSRDGAKAQEPPRRDRYSDRPRRTTTTTRKTTATPKEPASKPGEFIEPLSEMYALAGMTVSMFDHDGICGVAVAQQAESAATAWDELAQKNAAVRRSLRKLTQGSDWAAVVMAHVPIALAIAAAHMPKEGMPAPLLSMVENAEEEKAKEEEEGEVKPPPRKRPAAKRTPRKRATAKSTDNVSANARRSKATNVK